MTGSNDSPGSDLPRHPVRVVAQRTGLSGHVLRAWERRYGVVAPTRTEGGQRLYSDADIERLALLRRLTDAGGAISQLATLPVEELRRMVASAPPAPAPMEEAAEPWQTRALQAIDRLDGALLRRELGRAALALGVPRFLDDVVGPVLREVGDRWHGGRMSIAQEHLATAVVREVLGWIRDTAETDRSAPMLVVGTPPDQLHEGGALLAAATAAAEGWRVTYLGVNLPARDIAAAATRTGARAVALSLIHPAGDPALGGELATIRQHLPGGVALLVGGAAAERHRRDIELAGGAVMGSLGAFREQLHHLADGAG
ncbi:MAG TPA: MerR family transcriptional regulator [Gemmatimonadales bacterium]|nr:MerR family transcriptional regulator [Gemmatimonadales bacterium]